MTSPRTLKETIMRPRYPSLPAVLAVVSAAVLACSDSGDPNDGTKPADELNVLQLSDTSPQIFNPEASFYAKLGEDREARIFFQDQSGAAGEEYLRLRVDAAALLARPDGTPFLLGDSVLITIRVVDPARTLFEMEPSGLSFNPVIPAELRIHYTQTNPDLNADGVVNAADANLEAQLAIWRQEGSTDPFVRLNSALVVGLDQVEADVTGFSRYAIAY